MPDHHAIIESAQVPRSWREQNEALARAIRLGSVFLLVSAGLILIVDGFARGYDGRAARWLAGLPWSFDVAVYTMIAVVWLGPFALPPQPATGAATVFRIVAGAITFGLTIMLHLSPPSGFAGSGVFVLAVGLFIAIDEFNGDHGFLSRHR